MGFRRQVRKPLMPGLTIVLVTVVFSKSLEVRVNGSDVEVEKSTMRSKEARLNPSVSLPWFCRYHVGYIPAHELSYAAFEAG
jgi:hypothetical protein